MDGGRQRQPRVRADPARRPPPIAAPRAPAWRESRTSGRGSRATAKTAARSETRVGAARPRGRGPGRRAARPGGEIERLERQLADLRDKAASLRDAAAAAKAKLESLVAGRRQAASAMAASIAGRLRDRVDAEREITDLTAQIGRVAADIRPPHATLLSGYQNIDRLTRDDRRSQRPARGDRAGARSLRSSQAGRRRRPGDLHAGRDRRGAVGRAQVAARAKPSTRPPPSPPAAAGRRPASPPPATSCR